MRRFFVLALAAALVVGVALPAGAAPRNGNSVETFDCGDGVTILVQFGTSSAAVFDGTVEGSDGRRYVLSHLDLRIWAGHLNEEPDPPVEPLFAYEKTWGKRGGYDTTDPVFCSGFVQGSDRTIGDITEFFDVKAVGK